MPRCYVRKTDMGQITHDAIMECVLLVLNENRSIRKVAAEKGISKSVLCRYITKCKNDPTSRLVPNYKHSQVYSAEEELTLEDYLIRSSEIYHGLTPTNFWHLAFQMAELNGKPMPAKWSEEKLAGSEWLTGFLKRHPRLSIRSPEATSLARTTAFNRYTVGNFFNLLEQLIKSKNFAGSHIFNLDESGFTTVQNVPKVIAQKGVKKVGQVTSRERGELVTVCAIISAGGYGLPPVYIFPRKNFKQIWMRGTPEGSLGLAYNTGWMTSDNFLKVLHHFVLNTNCSVDNPTILTMDNHESHIALDAIKYAKENGVNLLTLPPHTSNHTQPLDRSVFGPMKAYFNDYANNWMMANPGEPIKIEIIELTGKAWLKAATPSNILSGFKVSGIWPFDRNVFDDASYLPSSITDREDPNAPPVLINQGSYS